uniref:Uncharacterized protein n=1 Tax=Arundo donax TaxID=35708 RepID=A0A0A8Y6C9_ARUDO
MVSTRYNLFKQRQLLHACNDTSALKEGKCLASYQKTVTADRIKAAGKR